MRITVSTIGKLGKRTPEQTLIDDYVKKTRWPITIREYEEKKSLSGDALKTAESHLLWSAVPTGARVVVLDERGAEPSSRAFAQKIASWRDTGVQDIVFMIGGADGHTPETRDRADWIVSFGRMTLPHFLARVVLIEQIYRAKMILDGHPYHRD